jgi:hypothetical protein
MVTPKAPKSRMKKFTNILEGLDQFKYEPSFKFTKKETRGSISGFCLTVLYTILMASYTYY